VQACRIPHRASSSQKARRRRYVSVAVILLHGFTHTGRSWDPVIAALGERYRAIAPDIRGHGSASERQPVTLEAVLDDVAGLDDGPVTLVGYSMGGRLALHAALALRERVERLIVIGASPGIADAAERAARRDADERLAGEIEQLSIEAVAGRWESVAGQVLAGQPPRVRKAARLDRLRNTPAGLARALRGLGTGALPPLWDQLAKLRMPVALVVGERDLKFRAISEQMASAVSGAKVVAVPDAGHAVHLEAPDALADVIASYGGDLTP
jgi:2-succinyl-6-hydroxy-2,4-cyclohexadiene-1-carboxylate synthase